MRKGWDIKKLGEVCSIVNGGTPDTKVKEFWDGNILWITPKDMGQLKSVYVDNTERKITDSGLRNSSAKVLPSYSVIISSRAPIGHLAINLKQMSTNQGCKGIIPSERINNVFLFYFLRKSVPLLEDLGSGTTFKELSGTKLFDVIVPLPPIDEQLRIVAILDETYAAIDKAKAAVEINLQNERELFESYLQVVFEKRGEGWEEKRLEEVTDAKCTLSYGIVQPGNEYENGLPVVRPTDLSTKFIKINGLKRVDPKLTEGYKRTTLIGDELLLCVRGNTGVVSIATKELKGGNVTRGIVPIRFNEKTIYQYYGYYLIISNYIQEQIKAKTYGAALMQINIGELRKILIPYPSLKEQHSIVCQLDALREETQKLERIYQQKLQALEELKKSILEKAFKGELIRENEMEGVLEN
jgi:type I restriction enzyme, S subunit